MADIFKLGRSILKGAKGFGKGMVPDKKLPTPGKYPIDPKQQKKLKSDYEANQSQRGKAFTRQLSTGLGLIGAAYALTRPKAESTAPVAAPTRTATAPTPTPQVERRTIASYYPVKEKKVGLMQNVKSAIVGDRKSSSTERQSLSMGETKPAGRDASSGNASRPSNYRKSDSRLGGFGGRKSKGADAGATPRAAVDYSSPVWSGQTPVNFADASSYGGKATQAPAPAVRTPVADSDSKKQSNIRTIQAHKLTRSERNLLR